MLFLDFYYRLRDGFHVPVTPSEYLTLVEAANKGLFSTVDDFYHVARSILIKDEKFFDSYDQAFLAMFKNKELGKGGVSNFESLAAELTKLAELPKVDNIFKEPDLTHPPEKEPIADSTTELPERDRSDQDDRQGIGEGLQGNTGKGGKGKDGTNTGGTSSGQAAMMVASERRFHNMRNDLILDTRHFQVALKKLRKLQRVGPIDELNLDKSIDLTCRNGGWIELVFQRRKKNDLKLLLLMDTGGSMQPHHQLVSRLFSAAHSLRVFKRFNFYYFHNTIYNSIFEDMDTQKEYPTAKLFRDYDAKTRLLLIGDASMHPWELQDENPWTKDVYYHLTSIEWLRLLHHHFAKAVWINPLHFSNYFHAESLDKIASIFPMFELTLQGLDDAIKALI
ncbi:MAG: VWA containing CoxE family protein [Promethearchaeota archaeon CR_4]|nr:MAG: VWA containing CoxE family protein [Candidatus Lokiarchaeota archaeon CR_4]